MMRRIRAKLLATSMTMLMTASICLGSCGGSSSTGVDGTPAGGGTGVDGAASDGGGGNSKGDASSSVDGAASPECLDACRSAKCQAAGCAEICILRCWRDDLRTAFVACLNDPATVCDAKADDNCTSKAVQTLSPHPGESDFVTACLQRRKDCGSSFADDYCITVRVLNDGCFAEAQTCLTKPCAEVGTCLHALSK